MVQLQSLYYLDPAQVIIIRPESIDFNSTNIKIRDKRCIPQYVATADFDPNKTLEAILESRKYVDVGHDGDDMVFMMHSKYQEEPISYDIYFKPGTTVLGKCVQYEVYLATNNSDGIDMPWTFHFNLHSKVTKVKITDQQLLGLLEGESVQFKDSNHDRTVKEQYPDGFANQIIRLSGFGKIKNVGSNRAISYKYPDDDAGHNLYAFIAPGDRDRIYFRPINDKEVIYYDLFFLGPDTFVNRTAESWNQFHIYAKAIARIYSD